MINEIRDTRDERRSSLPEIRNTRYASRFTLQEQPATSNERPVYLYERRATSDERRLFLHQRRATSNQRPSSNGFSLLEVVGVLAIIGILAAMILPKFIDQIEDATRTAEGQNLQAIAQAIELYLQERHSWPINLQALSPEYLQMGDAALTQNRGNQPRYYVLHPTMAAFDNAAGIAANEVQDTRYLLISNVSADAAPTITNAAEFDTWWDTDETSNPDLFIERGNVGHLFRLVNLLADTTGGSYSIDGTVTNSGCGITLNHLGYHLVGTRVGVDEGLPYTVPEIQFIVHDDTTHHFNPCRVAGQQWRSGPILVQACGGGVGGCGSPFGGMWMTTFQNQGSPSGVPGLDSWTRGEVIQLGDPNLTLEPGTTSGTFSLAAAFEAFSPGVQIVAVDYVKDGVTVGTTTTFDLLPGDLVLSTEFNATLTSNNTLSVSFRDVFAFRPATPGDYSSGSFYMLLDNIGQGNVTGISVVEKATVVGDYTVPAGWFLFSSYQGGRNHFRLLEPSCVGAGCSSPPEHWRLVDGGDINIPGNRYVYGVYLVEDDITLGGRTLPAGTLLGTMDSSTTVGDNSLSVTNRDIFALDVITSSVGPTLISSATASLVFEASDIGLSQNVSGITLAE